MIRILIIDNEAENIERLSGYLKHDRDIEILDTFENPIPALDYLQTHEVDLIFSDVVMPQMSGISFVKELYAHPVHPKVVLMSGIPGFSLKTWNVEAFGFLIKPYDRNQIRELLHRFKSHA